MKDDALIKTSIAGAALIPLCCLALTLAPMLSLSAWLSWGGYVLLPVVGALIAIAAGVFYVRRRRGADTVCCEAETSRPHGMQR